MSHTYVRTVACRPSGEAVREEGTDNEITHRGSCQNFGRLVPSGAPVTGSLADLLKALPWARRLGIARYDDSSTCSSRGAQAILQIQTISRILPLVELIADRAGAQALRTSASTTPGESGHRRRLLPRGRSPGDSGPAGTAATRDCPAAQPTMPRRGAAGKGKASIATRQTIARHQQIKDRAALAASLGGRERLGDLETPGARTPSSDPTRCRCRAAAGPRSIPRFHRLDDARTARTHVAAYPARVLPQQPHFDCSASRGRSKCGFNWLSATGAIATGWDACAWMLCDSTWNATVSRASKPMKTRIMTLTPAAARHQRRGESRSG